MFLVTVFCRTNSVCESCPVNKLTFSKWCVCQTSMLYTHLSFFIFYFFIHYCGTCSIFAEIKFSIYFKNISAFDIKLRNTSTDSAFALVFIEYISIVKFDYVNAIMH